MVGDPWAALSGTGVSRKSLGLRDLEGLFALK